MGTSASLTTPSGGAWKPIKKDIGKILHGDQLTPEQLIADVIAATGGLVGPLRRSAGSGGGGGGGVTSGTRGGGGGGGRTGSSGRAAVGRSVSGLGGFAAGIRDGGLDQAIATLGLGDLRGKPAAEVIALIAQHLSDDVDGLQRDLLAQALQDAILDTAILEGDRSYENLAVALEGFVVREGVEGLIELFLTHYVFGQVWTLIENHTERRAATIGDTESLASAVQAACQGHVVGLMQDLRAEGRFNGIDWFGNAGAQLGQGIVTTLEFRLRTIHNQETP